MGAHSFTGLGTIISKDVPPYVMVSGHPAKPHGLNSEGLKRRGFSADAIQEIRRAYKVLYRSNMMLDEAREKISVMAEKCPELQIMHEFLSVAERGIVR